MEQTPPVVDQSIKSFDNHFNKIFWFIVGICVFAAGYSVFLVLFLNEKAAERIGDTSIMFWLSTGAGGGIGFLIGASVGQLKAKTAQPAGTTAEINATITNVPEETKE